MNPAHNGTNVAMLSQHDKLVRLEINHAQQHHLSILDDLYLPKLIFRVVHFVKGLSFSQGVTNIRSISYNLTV